MIKESYVFGWLPCTLEEIELFLLVILCHDFSFFIFWMIFWLRQLCRKNLANKRALITCQLWQTESSKFPAPLVINTCMQRPLAASTRNIGIRKIGILSKFVDFWTVLCVKIYCWNIWKFYNANTASLLMERLIRKVKTMKKR